MKPFQLVLRYTRHYTWQLVITVISMLLLVGVQLTLPWIIKTLIDVVTDPGSSPDSWQDDHPPDPDRSGGFHLARFFAIHAQLRGPYR